MNKEELEKWLQSAKVLTEEDVTSAMRGEIEAVIGKAGLLHIIGLMLGAREAFYVQLSHTALGDPAQVARASVIQGKIQGVDLIRQTLLELHTPASADNKGA